MLTKVKIAVGNTVGNASAERTQAANGATPKLTAAVFRCSSSHAHRPRPPHAGPCSGPEPGGGRPKQVKRCRDGNADARPRQRRSQQRPRQERGRLTQGLARPTKHRGNAAAFLCSSVPATTEARQPEAGTDSGSGASKPDEAPPPRSSVPALRVLRPTPRAPDEPPKRRSGCSCCPARVLPPAHSRAARHWGTPKRRRRVAGWRRWHATRAVPVQRHGRQQAGVAHPLHAGSPYGTCHRRHRHHPPKRGGFCRRRDPPVWAGRSRARFFPPP